MSGPTKRPSPLTIRPQSFRRKLTRRGLADATSRTGYERHSTLKRTDQRRLGQRGKQRAKDEGLTGNEGRAW